MQLIHVPPPPDGKFKEGDLVRVTLPKHVTDKYEEARFANGKETRIQLGPFIEPDIANIVFENASRPYILIYTVELLCLCHGNPIVLDERCLTYVPDPAKYGGNKPSTWNAVSWSPKN